MTLIPKPVKRLYTLEDEEMETRAQTMHENLLEDLALFTAKFPWLDAAYVTSFQTDITTAVSFSTDTAVSNLIKVLTEDLDASVVEGMRALDLLDIYARLAFPSSLAKQRVFGQDKWEKARADQQKMFKALELAFEMADSADYKPMLIGKGMTQADIDNLNTVAANILLKDKLQEKAMSGRPVTTEERIEVHNIVWQRQQTINICSELVFRDDAAKRAQYLLYPPSSGGTNTISVEGDLISPGIVLIPKPDEVTYTAALQIKVEITGPGSGGARAFFAGFEGNPPGPNQPFMDVQVDQDDTGDAGADMGYDAVNRTLFQLQNIGMVTVHYKATFYL